MTGLPLGSELGTTWALCSIRFITRSSRVVTAWSTSTPDTALVSKYGMLPGSDRGVSPTLHVSMIHRLEEVKLFSIWLGFKKLKPYKAEVNLFLCTYLGASCGAPNHSLETNVLNQILNPQEGDGQRRGNSSLAPPCGVLVEEAKYQLSLLYSVLQTVIICILL